MIVLHMSVLAEELILYGEESVTALPSVPAPRGRRPRVPKAIPHPFSLDAKQLRRVLKQLAPEIQIPRNAAMVLGIQLPSMNRIPAPSTEALLDGDFALEGTPALGVFRVEGLRLPFKHALDLLMAAVDKKVLSHGVLVGPSFRYLHAVVHFAASMTARGRALPSLRADYRVKQAQAQVRAEAYLEPIFIGDDLEALWSMASAMPASIRAVVKLDEDMRALGDPSQVSPIDVLRTLTSTAMNYLFRESGFRLQGISSPRSSSIHQRWLHALASGEGGFTGTPEEIRGLADSLAEWHRGVNLLSRAPFRLCFRLEETPSDVRPDTGETEPGAGPGEEDALLQADLGVEEAHSDADPGVEEAHSDADLDVKEAPRDAGPDADGVRSDSAPDIEGDALPSTGFGIRRDRLETEGGPGGRSGSHQMRIPPNRLETEETGLERPVDGPKARNTPRRHQRDLPPFRLSFLMQSVRDPSLIVEVEQAATAEENEREALERAGLDLGRQLLPSIGIALRLVPWLGDKLSGPLPFGCYLSVDEAYALLSEGLDELRQAGFGVFLPSWWSARGRGVSVVARPKATARADSMRRRGQLSMSTLVQFDYRLALGGEELSPEELEALSSLKRPLVKLRGQWVEVDQQKIASILAALKSATARKLTVRDSLAMALSGEGPVENVDFKVDASGHQLSGLLEGLARREDLAEEPVPQGFRGVLRPYQVRGYSWLSFLTRHGIGPCLADDMGLGKTIQTIAFLLRQREQGVSGPILLVAPTSVLTNWQRETERFAPELRTIVYHGNPSERRTLRDRLDSEASLVITSYSLLHRDEEYLRQVEWDGVVLDEAQNIKNAGAKQSRAARSLQAGFRLALTGTPVENDVGDLWSIMDFLNPGLLGSREAFKRSFFVPIQINGDEQKAEKLRRLVQPFILRRLKTDKAVISDLPEKVEAKVYCSLTKEQVTLYEAQVREAEAALDEAEGIQRKGVVLATLTRLKQICNHPAHFLGDGSQIGDRSGKMNTLVELVEEVLAGGDRCLVFTQFAEMGTMIRHHIQEELGSEVLFLHGGVPRERREEMVKRFQSSDGPHVFVLSLRAGGTGLNLTAASHVIHFDRWWNPAVEDQASDRAYRIGQRKTVLVHKLICSGTLEERIDSIIEEKKHLSQKVIGSGEGWLTELSTDELKKIIRLSGYGKDE